MPPPPEAFKCLFVFISQQARGKEEEKKFLNSFNSFFSVQTKIFSPSSKAIIN
jgi:hypothetical protein